jgi:hypothetical protein
MAGGHFLVHRANVLLGDVRSETLELIGYDAELKRYTMDFFDSEEHSGRMLAIVSGNHWKFQGDALRFEGGFDAEDRVFSGKWEQRGEEGWSPLMDIRLERTLP